MLLQPVGAAAIAGHQSLIEAQHRPIPAQLADPTWADPAWADPTWADPTWPIPLGMSHAARLLIFARRITAWRREKWRRTPRSGSRARASCRRSRISCRGDGSCRRRTSSLHAARLAASASASLRPHEAVGGGRARCRYCYAAWIVCVRGCVGAWVRACVRACVRAYSGDWTPNISASKESASSGTRAATPFRNSSAGPGLIAVDVAISFAGLGLLLNRENMLCSGVWSEGRLQGIKSAS